MTEMFKPERQSGERLLMFGINSESSFLSLSLQKLNSPVLSVNGEGFIPMLSKLDDCIEYVSAHVSSLGDILAALLADSIL